jgi:CheY-like chemotaxis protein/anti-sigma regulatory factor (Ser/Thr protein kinase)
VQVSGDMTRLVQVVVNLLNNAAKYTPDGGHISISVAEEGAYVLVRVKDNGMGIAPQMIEHVFDLFAQGERTLDRAEGGLGIGLTLTRRLVALHGGRIVAQSAGEGRGSTFTVRLPRLNLALAAPAAVQGIARAARPRSILVVDDNVDSASSIAMFLRLLGHEVETLSSGLALLERLAAGAPPEIVLLDIGLPGIDGYDVARLVREKPYGRTLRLYAMTGYGQDEDRDRALAAGFDAHLVKPVAPDVLAKLIEAIPATVA